MGQLRPASADAGRGPRRQRLARSLEEVGAVLGLRAPRPRLPQMQVPLDRPS